MENATVGILHPNLREHMEDVGLLRTGNIPTEVRTTETLAVMETRVFMDMVDGTQVWGNTQESQIDTDNFLENVAGDLVPGMPTITETTMDIRKKVITDNHMVHMHPIVISQQIRIFQ